MTEFNFYSLRFEHEVDRAAVHDCTTRCREAERDCRLQSSPSERNPCPIQMGSMSGCIVGRKPDQLTRGEFVGLKGGVGTLERVSAAMHRLPAYEWEGERRIRIRFPRLKSASMTSLVEVV